MVVCLKFMNKFLSYLLALLIILISNNLVSKENEVIFKINNESFTSLDLENRKNYLLFVGDNSSLSKKQIIEDLISINIFKIYYSQSENKLRFNEIIEKVYKDIIDINTKNKDFDINNFNKKNIYNNLELDLIRKSILENFLKDNHQNININNNEKDMIYNYNIEFINIDLRNLNKNKDYIKNNNFKDIKDVENFLLQNEILYIKKNSKFNKIENVNNIIKNNLDLDKKFFKIENSDFVTFFSINKEFQTHNSLSFILYSIKSAQKLDRDNLECNILENTNIESKEYEFEKLNKNIKKNLVNINDFVEIKNEDNFIYIILCDLKFNKDLINNIILNKKINILVKEIEDNFIEKFSKKYNLIVINE